MNLAETARLTIELVMAGNFKQAIKGAKGDLTGLSSGTKKATTQVKGMSGAVGGMTTKLKGLAAGAKGSILQGVGLGAGMMGFQLLTKGIGMAVDAIGDAIGAASDLAESQSKVDAVFGDSARAVHDWANDLDSSFGISVQAAEESAGTIGNFTKALGLADDEALKVSTSLTELSGDLSSFNNINVDDVLVSLRSGLAGEAEPMRRLGVDVSAARVESILLAKGIAKVNGKFTEGEKVLGRYQAIMEDTSTAQGDAARTTDTLAGQQRVLKKEMGDAMATIGEALLPVAQGFTALGATVIPAAVDAAKALAGVVVDIADDLNALVTGEVRASTAAQLMADSMGIELDLLLKTTNQLRAAERGTEALRAQAELLGNAEFETAQMLEFGLGALSDMRTEQDKAADSTHELTKEEKELQAAGEVALRINARQAQAAGQRTAYTHQLTAATGDLTDAERSATRQTISFAAAFADLDKETADAVATLRRFTDEADAIGETRSLGQINDDLRKQIRLRAKAAREGKTGDFARATAAIDRLEEEKALRRLGNQATAEWAKNKKKERGAQLLVTAGIADTTKEAKTLLTQTRKKYRVSVLVDDRQLSSAITRAYELGAALSGFAGTIMGSLPFGQRKDGATGATYYPGDYGFVGERGPERIRNVGGATVVSPIGGGGGGGSVINLRPRIEVAARQVEQQTSLAVRTSRTRANT